MTARQIFSKLDVLPIGLILLALGFGIFLCPSMPPLVPSHWNAAGEIDAYSSREFSVWFLPLVTLGTYLVLTALPFIDPRRERYREFKGAYLIIKVAFVLFMLFIYGVTLASAVGHRPNMNLLLALACGLLFIVIGLVLPRLSCNYFAGIRTPWTLDNEEVWRRTHRVGGRAFIVAGLITMVGALVPPWAIAFILGSTLGAAGFTTAYSFVIYRRLGFFDRDNESPMPGEDLRDREERNSL